MAAPYVCLSCRAKQLLPRIRHTRLMSYTAADRSTTQIRDRIEARRSGAGGEAPTRGRYSGKELRPQELLNILDEPGKSRPVRPRSYPEHNGSHSNSRQPTGTREGLPIQKEKILLLPELQEKRQLFIDLVDFDKEDFPRAWEVLRDLATVASEHPDIQRTLLMNGGPMTRATLRLGEWTVSRLMDALAGGSVNTTLPSPSQFLATLRALRYAKTKLYTGQLWEMVTGIFESKLEGPMLDIALKELINMWRITLATRIQQQESLGKHALRATAFVGVEDDEADWSFLPSASIFASIQAGRRSHGMFAEMLHMLVPLRDFVRVDPEFRDYASSALMLLDVLRHNAGTGVPVAETPQARPFVKLLETMLAAAPAPRVPVRLRQKLDASVDQELSEKYRKACHRLELDILAVQTPRTTGETSASPTDVKPTADAIQETAGSAAEEAMSIEPDPESVSDPIERFSILCQKRLGRAVEQQNMRMIEQIQREIFADAASHKTNTTALPLELFEALMNAFMSLHNLKKAVEVWSFVTKSGYKPTAKTYTVMMRGAQACRDLSGMEAFWQSMRKNGVQPDHHAWSVRVFGLLKQPRALQQGLQALNEMGREWLAAAKAQSTQQVGSAQKKQAPSQGPTVSDLIMQFAGDVNGVARPNLIVMNTAISALASSHDKEIPKVLSWGRSFGVEPDLVTYNALINIAMRHHRAEDALKLLKRMHSHGIQANSTTWTVLLTALFQEGFLDNLNPAQQQEKILVFIDSLENRELGMAGVDDKGYALIIDRLLKIHGNATAAGAVLSHMISRGKQPTAHIYTILTTSYFQQAQPDFAAVEALWKQIQASNNGWGTPMDGIFYDRIIEGYASFHRVVGLQPCLDFLRRSRQAGQKPGWKALEAVARALADRSDWPRLKAMVDDVRQSLSEARGATHSIGQRDFWDLVLATGILREEGIERPEQLLPREARISPLVSVNA